MASNPNNPRPSQPDRLHPPVPITGLRTRSIGNRLHVLLEIEGQWRLVQDEALKSPLQPAQGLILNRTSDSLDILRSPIDTLRFQADSPPIQKPPV